MSALGARLLRFADLRRGEIPPLARAAGALFLIVAAHTTLETARDALLLTRFPPNKLGIAYVAVALTVLPHAVLMAKLCARFGARKTLVGGLVNTCVALSLLFLSPVNTATVLGVYVVSGLIGGILLPLFWNLFATVFTVAEGRRLLGLVAAAGTLGAVAGSGTAATLVRFIPMTALLLVSASVAVMAVFVLPSGSLEPSLPPGAPNALPIGAPARQRESLRSDPFVRRVALLVMASSSALIVLDFYFKWTVTRSLSADRMAGFIATFYAFLNVGALLAQLVVTRPLIRRLGLAWTILLTPLFLALGGTIALVSGGAMAAVLLLKTIDGVLRNSLHRVTMELAYLPLPASTRTRAKPLIDGALVRTVQGIAGAALFAAGWSGHLSAPWLGAATVGLAGWWLLAASRFRRSYVAVLRRAIVGDVLGPPTGADPLDVESAEALIGHLSNDDPPTVTAAMDALAKRGRSRMIPALILLHEEEAVLTRALAIFASSHRKDWIGRAKKLLRADRESVRIAAARALAAHGELELGDLATDAGPRMRGYAALYLALARRHDDPAIHPRIVEILRREGPEGEDERLGLLSAMADAPRNERLLPLVEALAARSWSSRDSAVELARAATSQRTATLIPALISRLTVRDGREAVRAALLSFDTAALDKLRDALAAASSSRALRVHIPNTIARFGSKPAATLLLETIETDSDGLVRYKALRALGRLVAEGRVTVDRVRVERLAWRNLLEHYRLLGLRGRLDPVPLAPGAHVRKPTLRLLVGILDDKLRQSLERTFRLLKIAYPNEDIHRVHLAYISDDKRRRANAAELLYALLPKRDQEGLRALLRIAAEETSFDELIERSRDRLPLPPPATQQEALDRLLGDHDETVAALAELHVGALAGQPSRVAIGSRERAKVELALERSADGLASGRTSPADEASDV
jgi:AAA family ATP:ADP antiporter